MVVWGGNLEIPFLYPLDDLVITRVGVGTILEDETYPYNGDSSTRIQFGTNSGLSLNASGQPLLGAGDFTIECFLNTNYTATTPTFPIICQYRANASDIWMFGIRNRRLYFWINNVTALISSIELSFDQWQRVAVSRRSGILKLWIDGSQVGNIANTTNYSYSIYTEIGFNETAPIPTGRMNISGLRIARDISSYP